MKAYKDKKRFPNALTCSYYNYETARGVAIICDLDPASHVAARRSSYETASPDAFPIDSNCAYCTAGRQRARDAARRVIQHGEHFYARSGAVN